MKPKGSTKSVSVYSVELPDTPNELLDDRNGKLIGINFTKTFMQFMCPSCCGGLFSEPKGSVYTKRQPKKTDTIKSETTTISLEENVEKNGSGVFSSSVDTHRQMATDNLILEEVVELAEDEQVDASDFRPNSSIASRNDTIIEHIDAEEPVTSRTQSSPPPARPVQKTKRSRKLKRDETVREEIHMYSKELTEKVKREHDDHSENGEAKWSNILRKTSFPNNEIVPDDTVVELKIAGKDYVEVRKQNGANEALFDFQAFLRKTNTTRQSLRRFSDIAERFPDETSVIAQLLPNVVLEGTVYNL